MFKKSWFALSLMILFMLGVVSMSSFGAITIETAQLSVYNPDNHYGTAIRKGTDNVPILQITITSTEDDIWRSLQLTYTGTSESDVSSSVDVHGPDGLVSTRSMAGGVVTFPLSEPIAAGATVEYEVKLDIVSGAGSNRVKLGFDSASFDVFGDILPADVTPTNPLAEPTVIDASAPELDDTIPFVPGQVENYHGIYDRGTKTLKLRFFDKLDPTVSGGKVTNPLVRLVWTEDDDDPTQSQIDLSKIRLRDLEDGQSITLSGATLLWPGPNTDVPILWPGGGVDIPGLIHFPVPEDTGKLAEPLKAGDEFPEKGASALHREVWIKLTPDQDAHVNNNILPDPDTPDDPNDLGQVIELYIKEALWDAGSVLGVNTSPNPDKKPADGDFKNLIAEKADAKILVIGDTEPPELVDPEDKPVRFDSETRELTLTFTESIDADPRSDVRLSDILIRNHIIDVTSEDPLEYGEVVDDEVTLTGATVVSEGYGPVVTISLTPTQRDVLKGDHPQLLIKANAVKDIIGNRIEDTGYVNANVTPPLLSGSEVWYDGNLADAKLLLYFTEELSTVNPTKVTVTNERDESPFKLTDSEFDTIISDDLANPDKGITRVAVFDLSKAHRDKISLWQKDDNIEALHVSLDAGAVVDIFGTPNELMAQSERILWDEDTRGPLMTTNLSTYNQSTRLLKVHFDENLDLTPENDETIDDLIDSSLITLSPIGGTASGSITLSNDELVPNQTDDWWLEYTLTLGHNDEISKWKGADTPATGIKITVSSGAVEDINGNLATANTGKSTTIGNITSANWIADTVAPTFVAAFYSANLKRLVLRFSETVGEPVLTSIQVHAAGETPVGLGADARLVGSPTDTITIENMSTAANAAIFNVGNPQVDIGAGAVSDLAGIPIKGITNRQIQSDVGGPRLSVSGNTYEHISLEDDEVVQDALLTLSFSEIIDVSTITDLSKIKLQAGTTSVALIGEVKVLTQTDASTVKIEIKAEDTVGKIASLQLEHDTLFVVLEAGAVKDLAGTDNTAGDTQALEKWIGDTRQPELDHDKSYYIHALRERGNDYARLVLVFDELMETRSSYLDFDGIVVANPDGDSVTLTAEELVPDQGLSKEIHFNLTDAHRDTISDWGKPNMDNDAFYAADKPLDDFKDWLKNGVPDADGKSDNTLDIFLAEGSVSDRAGNSVVVKSIREFAKSAPDPTPTDDPATVVDRTDDKYKYDSGDKTKLGETYSSWQKDLKRAQYVSSTYNANDKWMTITFDESMDQTPKDRTVFPNKMTVRDKNEQNEMTLAREDINNAVADWQEEEKTNTIKFKLTPEKDAALKDRARDVVGQEPQTVYLYLEKDAAVDFSGLGNDVANKEKITYTKDATKPTLVKTNGDDTTYRHKGKDFGGPDDITGLLSLVFNEAVDKNYDLIDASKIRLSNTSSDDGFVLTQDEIYTAAGFRVYPLEPEYVHIIQFDLNDAHWNTIANEKWSTMYIQMQAGAVKDTSGNEIDAVTIDIHGDHYHTDDVAPDVRVPASPISTASVGEDITITAQKITDDSPITEVRLYYQVGGAVRTYVPMENTTGDTYVGTIPGSAVTNKGLCYYVWAVDLWDNENITPNGYVKMREADADEWFLTPIPGGLNVKVTGSSVELPANTLPVFDSAAVPSTYRMLSAPLASPSTTNLLSPFGVAGVDWLAWKYTGGPENNGYQAGHDNPFNFSSGVAAWVGTVNSDKALTVTGDTSQISDKLSDDADQDIDAGQRYKYEIELHAGWNQIGVPFNFSRNWDKETIPEWSSDNIADVIYWFTGEKDSYSFASLDSTVPNQDVFATSWTGSGIPDNALVWSGWPGSLDPWGGYWIFSNREGAKLKLDPTVPGKGVLPTTPAAPSVQMPYNWSVKVMPEASGVYGTAKFAGIVSDADNGIDRYDVMDLPALPGQTARLSFITESGDYLQDMKAPADEMFWHFKVDSAVNTPVTLRFDPSAVPSEYRTVLLLDTVTEAATNLREVSSYAYKSSEKVRNFKLIISKAHLETYIVPKRSVLLQNYPNPFNPETWVPYRLSTAGDVTINIYNVAGQLVRTLELGHREAGSYTVRERAAYWDGRNITGERVASGVYFYHIQSGSFHATKRMVIVK